jgi:hypothetical protein
VVVINGGSDEPADNCEGQDDSEPQPCGLDECDCADYERRGGTV